MTVARPATHYSGVLVVVPPDRVVETVRSIKRLESVEVHRVDAPSGKIIVVQEGSELKQLERRLLDIRGLTHVALAEPVYYFVDEERHDESFA